jgi:hypothetical protein
MDRQLNKLSIHFLLEKHHGYFLRFFLENSSSTMLIVVEGARLLREQRASYLSLLLARHATRKLAAAGFSNNAGATLNIFHRGHRTPRGKRASWNGNQPLHIATEFANSPNYLTYAGM